MDLKVKTPPGNVWRDVAPLAFPELVWMCKTRHLCVPEVSNLSQLFSRSGELSEIKYKKPGILFSE